MTKEKIINNENYGGYLLSYLNKETQKCQEVTETEKNNGIAFVRDYMKSSGHVKDTRKFLTKR